MKSAEVLAVYTDSLLVMLNNLSHVNLINNLSSCKCIKTFLSFLLHLCSHSCFLSGRSRPTITPDGPRLTVPLNGDFTLRCQSNSSVRWLREDRPARNLKEEQRQGQLTVLKVNKAGPQHMGKYSCREEPSGEKSSIHVYVKGKSAFCI